MIRLIIKGNPEQAREAATKRGIPIQVLDNDLTHEVGAETDEAHQLAVIKWFCEPTAYSEDKGFATGTLLYHS